MTMAPSTKATRAQAGSKQPKISTFGRTTKTAPAAASHKTYSAKIVPAGRDAEATVSSFGAGRKRRHDAIDDEETCKSEEQVTTPFSKKVRGTVHKPYSAANLHL